jgi:hypothetical protein
VNFFKQIFKLHSLGADMKMEKHREQVMLRVSFPSWLRAFFAIGTPLLMVPVCIALINTLQDKFTLFSIVKSVFLILAVSSTWWAILVLFSTIYATQSGIQRRGLLRRTQIFAWNEIMNVENSRFGIPHDAAYIVSKNGERMTVARSMTGYTELLRLIQEKAPNIKAKGLSENLWLSKRANSWKGMLIFLVFFIAYVIIRKLTGW